MKVIQRTYYLILSLFWLGTALPMALTVLLGQARGLDLFQIGLLMGVYSLTIVLLEVPTGGLADAIGRKRVAVLAYSCITLASTIFYAPFHSPSFSWLLFSTAWVGRWLRGRWMPGSLMRCRRRSQKSSFNLPWLKLEPVPGSL